MPAERTKDSRHHGANDDQMVWTMPADMLAPAGGIAFAPNVTPGTFNDPPPMVDAPPCESILFPPSESCPAPRRSGHSRKKPENHIPRPPNAFILFRSSFIKSQHVSTEVETNHSTLSKIIGLTWQNLPNEERQIWHSKAKLALEEHKRKFPQYAFKPLHSKGKGGGTEKRKVREVGPKDHKRCVKIAELLVKGKKGHELDEAIQEFDKHHVPEVVTRFEAPITASMFRRPSSVPIPESEESKPVVKPRASSSQPTRRSTPAPPPEQVPVSVPEALYNPSPFDQYSFPESTPSFDFNTFSFDHVAPSLPSFHCNSLAQAVSPLDGATFISNSSEPRSRQLSIDTSFLSSIDDSWTRSSSPMSSSTCSMPATPFDSPSPEAYRSYTLEAPSDYSMAKSFGDLGQYPAFVANDCSTPYGGCEDYSVQSSVFTSFHLQQESQVHMTEADLDFSAFMASLPPCSL